MPELPDITVYVEALARHVVGELRLHQQYGRRFALAGKGRAVQPRAAGTVAQLAQDAPVGRAVARGMLAAKGTFRVFLDADLAYPIEEAAHIVRHLEAGADVAVACRVLPESRYLIAPSFIRYIYTRHVMSRTFNWLVRRTLLPGILDTQAGLKGFTAHAADTLFPRLTIETFGFDVELLYVALRHGLQIAQVPVRFRYDNEPSSMRFTPRNISARSRAS